MMERDVSDHLEKGFITIVCKERTKIKRTVMYYWD